MTDKAADGFEGERFANAAIRIISAERTLEEISEAMGPVEVFAQRARPGRQAAVRVTEAQLTYVAVDDKRQPRVVPGATVEA